ncbi:MULTISPECIES: response regulator transcription factor [unclassified Curtobacterium]|uniref:response regulator n=1 Tax=unclassified Curtobacterium TaxID=257496 RepID=UPI000D931815|nr:MULTISPECIES: response regulator transcription factor [unclassified Curtobacterium]PYY35529.1 DNA-binding response regulator [Curtobacterium sp. MCBD17_030]PZE38503.1 DNA-binding response regulator [Curtobacterium sp. MCPF17_031]PZF11424.1 DNA-binding response regulator [Curtobacterium sp. MCPF17_011]
MTTPSTTTTPDPIRVVLVDDQSLIRAGLRALVSAEPGMQVVGEASDGDGAVTVAARELPDVVLMDIRMPGTDGLTATRRISADPALAAVHVVVLTTFEEDDTVFEAIRGGAAGFLVKDTEPAELLRAIRTVVAGESLLSPGPTRSLVEAYAAHAKPVALAPELDALTDRERQVMRLVASGLTNAEIAERLFVSPATTKTHVSRAMIKLGARDRAQLVVFAYETGLVTPGWTG